MNARANTHARAHAHYRTHNEAFVHSVLIHQVKDKPVETIALQSQLRAN